MDSCIPDLPLFCSLIHTWTRHLGSLPLLHGAEIHWLPNHRTPLSAQPIQQKQAGCGLADSRCSLRTGYSESLKMMVPCVCAALPWLHGWLFPAPKANPRRSLSGLADRLYTIWFAVVVCWLVGERCFLHFSPHSKKQRHSKSSDRTASICLFIPSLQCGYCSLINQICLLAPPLAPNKRPC